MRRITLALLLAPLGFLTFDTAFAAKSANGPLVKLFDTTWEEDLADDPLTATQIGDPRYNDRWPDMSVEASTAAKRRTTHACSRCSRSTAKTRQGRPAQLRPVPARHQDTHRGLPVQTVGSRCAPSMVPLLAQTAEFAPFNTVKDYDNWIARINTRASTSTSGSCC
jgi:uncharacterized protein (DUF885 family)